LLGLVFVRFRTLQHHHHRQFHFAFRRFRGLVQPSVFAFLYFLASASFSRYPRCRICVGKELVKRGRLTRSFPTSGTAPWLRPHLVTHYDRFGRSTAALRLDERSVDRERHLLRAQHPVSNLGNSYLRYCSVEADARDLHRHGCGHHGVAVVPGYRRTRLSEGASPGTFSLNLRTVNWSDHHGLQT
jgi:hypothetical protein